MAVLIGLVLALQAVTYFLVVSTSRNHARQHVRDELTEALRTFQRLTAHRVAELRLAVRLLASDYAFASAFAKLRDPGDAVTRETLRSVLQNYRARIGTASFLRLISLEGVLLADTTGESGQGVFEEPLIRAAEDSPDLEGTSAHAIGDSLYLVILRALMMPEPSAWVSVGFPLDNALAAEFDELSLLDIAFVNEGRLAASTAPLADGDWLPDLAQEPSRRGLIKVLVRGRAYIGGKMPFPGDLSGKTQIVMLRSLDDELAPFRQLENGLLAVNGATLAAALLCAIFIARGVTRPVVKLSEGVERIARGDYKARVSVKSHDEFNRLASTFNAMAAGLEERNTVRDLLGRSLSPEIAAELLRSGLALGGEVREATILFTDLRGFTAYGETQPPQALVAQLNAYFTAVSAAIEAEGGVIDKFIGDAIMAVFGAPVAASDHADRAVAAALGALRAEHALNASRAKAGLPPLATGIGISTGSVVAGSIGSPSRCNYTVIGDEVNLASRLESLTKDASLRARIICSDRTRQALQKEFPLRDLGMREIRGKEHVVRIWAVDPENFAGDGRHSEACARK